MARQATGSVIERKGKGDDRVRAGTAVGSGTQMFPPLDAATEAALRASIERFGVLAPVHKDQDGRILDGHHRARLASELGIEYEVRVQHVADDAEAREIARTLNEDRRQLTPEQRRPVVIALHEEGHSQRAIARTLKVDPMTVNRDLKSGVAPATPEKVIGLDGKVYPARQPTIRGAQQEEQLEDVHPSANLARQTELRSLSGRARQAALRRHTIEWFNGPLKWLLARRSQKSLDALEILTPTQARKLLDLAQSSSTYIDDVIDVLERKASAPAAAAVREVVANPPTGRAATLADAASRKLYAALSGINGFCLGLADFRFDRALAVATPDDIASWDRIAADSISTLRQLRQTLKEGGTNG